MTKQCAAFPGAYLAATLPFEVTVGKLGVLDCSIPGEWREDLGEALIAKYLGE